MKIIMVKEVMSNNIKSLHPKDKLERAIELFKLNDIHHLPVEVMGKLKGILSYGDILRTQTDSIDTFDDFIKKQGYKTIVIDDIMTSNPITISEDDSVESAIELMLKSRINSLPVVNNNKLSGIVTSYDIMLFAKRLLEASQCPCNRIQSAAIKTLS